MPKILGGVTAIVALLAGIFAQVDASEALGRATLAYLLGWLCGQVWYLLITIGATPSSLPGFAVPSDHKADRMPNMGSEGTGGD